MGVRTRRRKGRGVETMKRMSRNEQVVRYIVSRCGKLNARVRLIKFVYLADYLSRRYAGRPISTFEYRKHDYGPFDVSFYDVLKSLKSGGFIVEHERPWDRGVVYEYEDTGRPIAYDLSLTDLHVLNRVIEQYETTELRELLDDVVYATWPMKELEGKPLGTRLNMDAINRAGEVELGGLELDTMLRSRQEIQEGRYVMFEDFLHELQTPHP